MSVRYVIVESEIGAGTRGSSLGVKAMEVVGWNKQSEILAKYNHKIVEVFNNDLYKTVDTPNAIRIESVVKVLTNVADAVHQTVDTEFPVVLSGDHSIAAGTIAGIKKAYPSKRLGVVWIDAHADIHSPFTTPSGNVHGMPLAAALGLDNLELKINELSEKESAGWNAMKNLSGVCPSVLPEDTVYFGVRDTEEQEDEIIENQEIRNFLVEEIRYRGMDVCLTEAIERLDNCDLIYISFDVDSMDCDLISYGTGTPVSKGFDEVEIKEIISGFLETEKVACLEFVEINPTLDEKKNKMAETAFEILEEVLPIIEKLNN
ncbi:MAG: arginase [Salibacteraceae bacterium]|jgi:arginase